jgi:hypothetical protein
MSYTCKRCGAVANEPGHLCNPCGDRSKCSFCGAPDTTATHVCSQKLAKMKFVCDGCGRVAMEKEALCHRVIPGPGAGGDPSAGRPPRNLTDPRPARPRLHPGRTGTPPNGCS